MPPDFGRNVHCVLGLPFDAVTATQAEDRVRLAIAERRRCFLSTPNLNFAIGCLEDAPFLASVLQSDLSLADGWPIVFVARLTGATLPERVPGSTLFERLVASDRRPPVSTYFFGGPSGAANAACQRLNSRPSGVSCAGYDSPGFGSVEEMSTAAHIDRLNGARPDFLVVALGAKKGQAWISANLDRIEAPVISHLGAVVNFNAASISRAPRWVQVIGMEWLWRIKEEPHLWRRYARDGSALLRLLVTRVVPFAIHQRLSAPSGRALQAAKAWSSSAGGRTTVWLSGAWTAANVAPLRRILASHAASPGAISIDLSAATYLDTTAIALLSLLYGWQLRTGAAWEVVGASPSLQKTLRLACSEYLLDACGTEPHEG